MPGSMAITSPVDYADFPELVQLCQVREIRGVLVYFCVGRADDGMCDWHKALRVQHGKDGKGCWLGNEVEFR
jgi:hypothetical protein